MARAVDIFNRNLKGAPARPWSALPEPSHPPGRMPASHPVVVELQLGLPEPVLDVELDPDAGDEVRPLGADQPVAAGLRGELQLVVIPWRQAFDRAAAMDAIDGLRLAHSERQVLRIIGPGQHQAMPMPVADDMIVDRHAPALGDQDRDTAPEIAVEVAAPRSIVV